MNTSFTFNNEQFNRLFPFYFIINRGLQVISSGKSLQKLIDFNQENNFNQLFTIPRPLTLIHSVEDLIQLKNQLVVLESTSPSRLMLRGQFEYQEESDDILFVGSPWFGSMEQVRENNLVIDDFARHDPLIDLLHVMKSHEITNEDLKELIATINKQKNELKKANKEIHDIALFPMQNPDPRIRINFNGELLRMNPAAEKLTVFEYDNKQYSNQELFHHIATQINKENERWVFEASSNGKDFSFACITMKDYGYIHLYGQDVTQQNKDRRELERLSLIIHQTQNAVIVTDAQGKVEWVNAAFPKITGYTLEEVKGKTPGSVLQGPKTDPGVSRYMRDQIREAKPFVCEIYNYKKSGEGYWLRINGQPIFDKYGKVIQFFSIEEDITKEREAKKQLNAAASRMSTLIANLHAGILLENENRTIALINQEFCNLFNIPVDPVNLIGTDCSKSAEETKKMFKEPDSFIHNINNILADKKLVIGDNLELADGRHFERDFVPIWNETKYDGHLWIYRDITERVMAENQLKIAKKITEDLAHAKQNFLANMSHEIRTPMNAILGMSRQLQKTKLDERQHFYLDSISGASENLLVIINDILDLSKIEAGKLSLEQIGFEPKQVVGKVMQVMMHKAQEKGLELTNSICDSRLSDVLVGDPYRLNQILLNLVSNAIKFTEKGNVDISCEVIGENKTHQRVRLKIKDTGVGMDESFSKNIFSKFTQEDDSVSRRFGGTGLGMSICKELVDLMEGKISVESKKGNGTTVFFEIDFKKGDDTDLPKKETSILNAGNFKGKKILVVDDNEMNRLVATTILIEYGVHVMEAVNGKEAVDQLTRYPVDLVLMDMQMPVLNGLEATVKIRKELNLAVPVIALTANAIKGENEKCFAAGMNDYITKPFEENHFLNKISRWLDTATNPNNDMRKEQDTALFDLSSLKEIAKGNKAFVDKMIQLFIEQGPASVNEIKEAYATGDLEKVKKTAHRMKPSIDNMGIHSLKTEIRDIEKNAEVYQVSGQLEHLIEKVDTIINNVVKQLKK